MAFEGVGDDGGGRDGVGNEVRFEVGASGRVKLGRDRRRGLVRCALWLDARVMGQQGCRKESTTGSLLTPFARGMRVSLFVTSYSLKYACTSGSLVPLLPGKLAAAKADALHLPPIETQEKVARADPVDDCRSRIDLLRSTASLAFSDQWRCFQMPSFQC